ncbi:hypothetical protein O6H91_Y251700 [Diphasiastrum complanatum]|nr:hypothetical protein O6H91_Y251700 [Diphasiastrum complanatum]
MPRPGPRPYECIRRAWHTDAHQPLRGKLTQEILRVVTDLHKPETRHKKEWQVKLPTVVLRAEEILYSKAKSEADYMDVKTLRDRLEDAVDTMIRRTDAPKDGPYMEPCVEAALSLGCVPKSFPRGQRAGTRHSFGNTKRAGSSLSAASGSSSGVSPSQNQSNFPMPATQDHCTQDAEIFSKASLACLPAKSLLPSPVAELPMRGAVNPSLVNLARCSEPRSFLHTGHLNSAPVNSGFAVSIQQEHCPNKVNFQAGATATPDSEVIADLPVPNVAKLFAGYPFVRPSTRTSTEPASMLLNASLHGNSLHGSHPFQTPVVSEGVKSFTGGVHFPTPIFADMVRHIQAPVAHLGEGARSAALASYSSSHVSQFANLGRMQPTHEDSAISVMRGLLSEPKAAVSLTRGGSPAEQSTAASTAELDDLQLRLAPPGKFLSSSSRSQGFTSSGSCITHLPAQQAEDANRFLKSSLEGGPDVQMHNACSSNFHLVVPMNVGVASSNMTLDSHLGRNHLNEKCASFNANTMNIPATKRQRLYTQTSSMNARDSGFSEESCDLQIGLNLKMQR